MLAIEHVANYIPEQRLDVEERLLSLNYSKAEAKVFKKIYQLQQVPKETERSLKDFIKMPLQNMLQRSGVVLSHIKYIVHTHTGRVISAFGESLLRDIKYELGLKYVQTFSISLNNCASTITALSVVNQLLDANDDINAKAIIVTADLTFTPILQAIPNVSVMGDASTAVLLGKSQLKHRFLGEVSNIYGRYAAGSWMLKDRSFEFEEKYVSMVIETIQAVLKKTGLTLDKIKLILPHNVNFISWEKVRSGLSISKDKIYLKNIARYGHCFGADIFINYLDALEDGCLESNDYYMMVTVGLGATVSAAIFQY